MATAGSYPGPAQRSPGPADGLLTGAGQSGEDVLSMSSPQKVPQAPLDFQGHWRLWRWYGAIPAIPPARRGAWSGARGAARDGRHKVNGGLLPSAFILYSLSV